MNFDSYNIIYVNRSQHSLHYFQDIFWPLGFGHSLFYFGQISDTNFGHFAET